MAFPDRPRLDTLPPELILRILDHACPTAIARVAQLNKQLNEVATTESVWKSVVQNITSQHSTEGGVEPIGLMSELWIDQARFLVPLAHYLGYWASSQPYSSRIVRVKTEYANTTAPGASAAGVHLRLVAEQLVLSNLLESPEYSPSPPLTSILPAHAMLDRAHRSAYVVPRTGPGSHSPDSGLQVELLHEAFSWTPVFVITRARGARLPNDHATGPGSLRLQLERSRREVGTREALAHEGEEEGEDRRTRTAAMLALFAGRPPKRAWPTLDLFGGEAVERPGLGGQAGAPGAGEVRYKGALRGIHNYAVDELRPTVEHVKLPAREPPSPSWPGSDFSEQGRYASHCEGFHLVAVRTVSHHPSAGASRASKLSGPSRPQLGVGAVPPGRESRYGVGRNGGPAILWHGQERDPAERPRVAIVRAGGNGADGVGGLVLPVQQPLPDDELISEEVVRTEREDFLPLKAPASSVTFTDPPTTDATGEILAAHLEGLWVGTFGPHGLEVGHLNIRMERSGDVGPGGGPLVERKISLVKVTGDLNVGSGQISWSAVLDPVELPGHEIPPAGYVRSLSAADLGTVPSVTSETLLRWSAVDPTADGAEQPRWDAGSVAGAGQIALVGFVHRSWTGAIGTFIRSTKRVPRPEPDGSESAEWVDVDVVDEIRVRWKELGCVSVFKRVRA